jgi:hypothetical protein
MKKMKEGEANVHRSIVSVSFEAAGQREKAKTKPAQSAA